MVGAVYTSRSILIGDGTDSFDQQAVSGDATLAASGALTIAAGAVSYAKIQDVTATDRVLGRSTAGSGDVEEITCTAAARSVLDDATVGDRGAVAAQEGFGLIFVDVHDWVL